MTGYLRDFRSYLPTPVAACLAAHSMNIGCRITVQYDAQQRYDDVIGDSPI